MCGNCSLRMHTFSWANDTNSRNCIITATNAADICPNVRTKSSWQSFFVLVLVLCVCLWLWLCRCRVGFVFRCLQVSARAKETGIVSMRIESNRIELHSIESHHRRQIDFLYKSLIVWKRCILIGAGNAQIITIFFLFFSSYGCKWHLPKQTAFALDQFDFTLAPASAPATTFWRRHHIPAFAFAKRAIF